MTDPNRKFYPGREEGSENRIHPGTRPDAEMKHEVAQRSAKTDAHEEGRDSGTRLSGSGQDQTSGYGNREDRENPGKGLQQSGTRQSHKLPGEGVRIGNDERRSMSQNGAAIRDFEDRPSR